MAQEWRKHWEEKDIGGHEPIGSDTGQRDNAASGNNCQLGRERKVPVHGDQ